MEPHQRLKAAREAAGIPSAKQAAELFGWKVSSYIQHENGTRGIPKDKAPVYARRFRTTPEWLLYGEGQMRQESRKSDDAFQMVPVISWVSAGRLAIQDDAELIEPDEGVFTALSGLPRSKYFATAVRGDSMDRISPEGSVLIVDANDTQPRPGRAYIFSVGGEATYKLFRDDPVVMLEPYSTNPNHRPIFPGPEQEWAVVGRVVRTFLDLA